MKFQTREILVRRLETLKQRLEDCNDRLDLLPQHKVESPERTALVIEQVNLEGRIRDVERHLYNNPPHECQD